MISERSIKVKIGFPCHAHSNEKDWEEVHFLCYISEVMEASSKQGPRCNLIFFYSKAKNSSYIISKPVIYFEERD